METLNPSYHALGGISSNTLCAQDGVAGSHSTTSSESIRVRLIIQRTRANRTTRFNPSGHCEACDCASWDRRLLTSRWQRARSRPVGRGPCFTRARRRRTAAGFSSSPSSSNGERFRSLESRQPSAASFMSSSSPCSAGSLRFSSCIETPLPGRRSRLPRWIGIGRLWIKVIRPSTFVMSLLPMCH